MFLLLILGYFQKEKFRKTAFYLNFMLSLLSRGRFRQKLKNGVKNFLTIISNGQDFESCKFTKNNLVLLSLVYFVKVFHQREVIENIGESYSV